MDVSTLSYIICSLISEILSNNVVLIKALM